MNRKGKAIAILVLLLLPCIRTFGASVVVTELAGKVEVRIPGEAAWKPAEAGMELPLKSDISTGFRSFAVLDLGTSEIEVMALTRMTVEDIIDSAETVSTSLLLSAGTVRADVKTSETRTHDFTITSPIATAAVRGTSFIFNGYVLNVLDGIVLYINALGERISVAGGTASRTTGLSIPALPVVVLIDEITVSTTPVGPGTGDAATESTEEEEQPLQSSEDSGLPPEEGLCIDLIVE